MGRGVPEDFHTLRRIRRIQLQRNVRLQRRREIDHLAVYFCNGTLFGQIPADGSGDLERRDTGGKCFDRLVGKRYSNVRQYESPKYLSTCGLVVSAGKLGMPYGILFWSFDLWRQGGSNP